MRSQLHPGSPRALVALALALVATAITVALGIAGEPGRTIFCTASFAAFAAALIAVRRSDRAAALRFERSPALLAILAIFALALFVAASIGWGDGSDMEALRWALTLGAYGALALTALLLAVGSGRRRHQLLIALTAFAAIECLLGFVGIAGYVSPFAERIGGEWRPTGTVGDPVALGTLALIAVPAALAAVASRRRLYLIAGSIALALAGATISMASSSLLLVASLAVFALIGIAPGPTLRSGRGPLLVGAAVFAAAALLAMALIGGYIDAGDREFASYRLPASAVSIGSPALAGIAALAIGGSGLRGFWTRRLGPYSIATSLAVVLALAWGAVSFLDNDFEDWGYTPPAAVSQPPAAAADLSAVMELQARPLLGNGDGAELGRSAPPTQRNLSPALAAGKGLGIGGFALILLISGAGLAVAWRNWHNRKRTRHSELLCSLALAIILTVNLVEGSWQSVGVGAAFAICLGVALAADAQNQRLRQRGGPSLSG